MVPSKDAPSELIRAKDVGGFDRWAIPSFDPEVETPPEPEPEPAPAVEAEQKEILKIVRRMAEEGTIVVGGKSEDAYV